MKDALGPPYPTPSMKPNWYTPPSITRLLHYENPIPMNGDPDWNDQHGDKWSKREQIVYAAMINEKKGASP